MEQFIFEDADGEYTDDFETNDMIEALAYGREHHLKVVRVYYVEAGTETIADFTNEDVCTWCGKPIELEGTGLWEDPELEGADKRRYCDLSPNYRHAT